MVEVVTPYNRIVNKIKSYYNSVLNMTEDSLVSGVTFVTISSITTASLSELDGNPLITLLQLGGKIVKIVGLSGIGTLATFEGNKWLRENNIVTFKKYPFANPKNKIKGKLSWIRNYLPIFPRATLSILYGISAGSMILKIYTTTSNIYLTDGYYGEPRMYIPNRSTFGGFYA